MEKGILRVCSLGEGPIAGFTTYEEISKGCTNINGPLLSNAPVRAVPDARQPKGEADGDGLVAAREEREGQRPPVGFEDGHATRPCRADLGNGDVVDDG